MSRATRELLKPPPAARHKASSAADDGAPAFEVRQGADRGDLAPLARLLLDLAGQEFAQAGEVPAPGELRGKKKGRTSR